jgi:predicted enzyme involved in methoxymalonyl-ACP biosynthesis
VQAGQAKQMMEDARDDAARPAIRALVADGRFDDAWLLLRSELMGGENSAAWSMARSLLRTGAGAGWAPATKRKIRIAVLCTYEAAEASAQLRVACLALGIDVELYVAPYGQVEQEVLDGGSQLRAFSPTHVLFASTTADLGLPELAEDPEEALAAALQRWRTLWELVRSDLGARVIQHAFVVPDETPLGHLAMRLASSRLSLVRELNHRLAEEAGSDVLLVDCERLAARIGKARWTDARLW